MILFYFVFKGITRFSDLTKDEFKQRFLSLYAKPDMDTDLVYQKVNATEIRSKNRENTNYAKAKKLKEQVSSYPLDIDWTLTGYTTSIKDQVSICLIPKHTIYELQIIDHKYKRLCRII